MTNFFSFEAKKDILDEEDTCYQVQNSGENKLYDYQNNEDEGLNVFLDTNFDKKSYNNIPKDDFITDPYSDCREETLKRNRDAFLISDFSFSDNTIQYDCYIPKNSINCEVSGNFKYLFAPVNKVFNDMFGEEPLDVNSESRPSDICRNFLTSWTESSFNLYNSETACLNYKDDTTNVILPRNNKFLLYKTKFIDNRALINDIYIKPLSYYEDENNGKLNITILQDKYDEIILGISNEFHKDMCEKKDYELIETKKVLDSLNDFYKDDIFQHLQNLTEDISNLTLLTKYDTQYLRTIETKIEEEERKLMSIFGLDGANNGKLFDVKYMKNQKLKEIIIISLLLIFLIFIISRKK